MVIVDLADGYRIKYSHGSQYPWNVAYPGDASFNDPSLALLGARFCIWRHRRRVRKLQRMEGK